MYKTINGWTIGLNRENRPKNMIQAIKLVIKFDKEEGFPEMIFIGEL